MSIENSRAFNETIKEYLPLIKKICFGFAANQDELNDYTQEVLIQIWRKLPTFKGNSKLSTWIYRVTVNICLYEIGKKKKNERIKEELLQFPNYKTDALESSENEEQIHLLYASIKKLSPVNRAIIMLYLEKKTHQEIAEIIGMSPSNIGVRINRIKKKLKKLMRNEKN